MDDFTSKMSMSRNFEVLIVGLLAVLVIIGAVVTYQEVLIISTLRNFQSPSGQVTTIVTTSTTICNGCLTVTTTVTVTTVIAQTTVTVTQTGTTSITTSCCSTSRTSSP